MKELIKAYEEYITLLEKECGSLGTLAFVHGMTTSAEDIDKGEELRKRIKELKAKII